MNILTAARQAAAFARGQAVPRASVRHLHLNDAPLVVALQVLAGEPFAPLAIVWGTDPAAPAGELVVPEPRNRDLRYLALTTFADALLEYLEPYLTFEVQTNRKGNERPVCEEAPQIVLPTAASVTSFGEAIGRGVLYSPTAPTQVRRAAAFATFLAQQADRAGQALLVPATGALGMHWVTGQAELENENLAALLAWIDPEPTATQPQRLDTIGRRELLAWGPLRRPEADKDLATLVERYNRATSEQHRARLAAHIAAEVLPGVRDAYRGTHHALTLLRTLDPVAPGAAARRNTDRDAWAWHAQRDAQQRAQGDIPRFSTRDSAEWAARIAADLEDAAQALPAVMAFDDPLIMAEHIEAGEAIAGTVLTVDLTNREVKPGNTNRTRVPLFTLRTDRRPAQPAGTWMRWADDPSVEVELRAQRPLPHSATDPTDTPFEVTFAVMAGHRNGTTVPAAGDEIVVAALEPASGGFGRPGAGPVPWTHRPTTGAAA